MDQIDPIEETLRRVISELALAIENANPEAETGIMGDDGLGLCFSFPELMQCTSSRLHDLTTPCIEIEDSNGIEFTRYDPQDPLFSKQVAEHIRTFGLKIDDDWYEPLPKHEEASSQSHQTSDDA